MLSIKVNRKTSYFFLLLALLLALFTYSAAAEATTPTIKYITPADGSYQSSTSAYIVFEVSDPHEIAQSGYYMVLDGFYYSYPGFEYTSGYWVEVSDGG